MIENVQYRVLGVMSGTSLDGVDLAICTFSKTDKWTFEIIKSETVKYSNLWKKNLAELHLENEEEITQINKDYGKFLGEIISSFLLREKVDFIASHGHTIFHEPENKYTLQIGCGETISKKTKTTTINDFRSLDISLSGQGAPLVPIGDLHLFSDFRYCINLGGFANISIKEGNNNIKAFDICPVNIVMNKISQKLGIEFDERGEIAERGKLIPGLLIKFNNLDFYKKDAPKSLGREWVEKFINPLLLEEYKSEDILHTFCEHIAMQIGVFLKDKSALFTGGGVFNTYLMSRIQHYSTSEIITPSKDTINFKEALIFAFLGVLRVRNEVNCLKSVTGAKHDNCGGIISKY
jgi:anhydro-N-acetylmuramic acid kinase